MSDTVHFDIYYTEDKSVVEGIAMYTTLLSGNEFEFFSKLHDALLTGKAWIDYIKSKNLLLIRNPACTIQFAGVFLSNKKWKKVDAFLSQPSFATFPIVSGTGVHLVSADVAARVNALLDAKEGVQEYIN